MMYTLYSYSLYYSQNIYLLSNVQTFYPPVRRNEGGRTIRDRRYKLIENYTGGGDEFFDLEEDPYETENLLDGPLSDAETAALENLRYWLGNYSASSAPENTGIETGESGLAVSTAVDANAEDYSLWRSSDLINWTRLTEDSEEEDGRVTFETEATDAPSFYSIAIEKPVAIPPVVP